MQRKFINNLDRKIFYCKNVKQQDVSHAISRPTSVDANQRWIRDLLKQTNNPNYIISNQSGWFNYNGWTLLQAATYLGDVGLAEELLQKGANPNLPIAANSGSWSGWTAIAIAINYNYIDLVKVLLTHKAYPFNRLSNFPTKRMLKKLLSFDLRFQNFMEPLCIRSLLDIFSHCNAMPTDIFEFVLDRGHINAARLLLERGTYPELTLLKYRKIIADLEEAKSYIEIKLKDKLKVNGKVRLMMNQELDTIILTKAWVSFIYYHQHNEYNQAITQLLRIIDLDKSKQYIYQSAIFAYYALCAIDFNNENYDRIQAWLDRTLTIPHADTYQALTHHIRCAFFLEAEQHERAIQSIDKAIALDSKEPAHHTAKFDLHYQMNQRDQAVLSIKNAIRMTKELAGDASTCPYAMANLELSEKYTEIKKEYQLSFEQVKSIQVLLNNAVQEKLESLVIDNDTNKANIKITMTQVEEVKENQVKIWQAFFELRQFQQILKICFEELKTTQNNIYEDINLNLKDEIAKLTQQIYDTNTEISILRKKLQQTDNRVYFNTESIKNLTNRLKLLESKRNAFELQVEAEAVYNCSGNPNLVPFFRLIIIGLESLLGGLHDLSTKLFGTKKSSKGVTGTKYFAKAVGLVPVIGDIFRTVIKEGANAVDKVLAERQINIIMNFAQTYTKYEASDIAVRVAMMLTERYQHQLFRLPEDTIKDLVDQSKELVLKNVSKTPIQQLASYILEQIGCAILSGDLIPMNESRLKPEHCTNAVVRTRDTLEDKSVTLKSAVHCVQDLIEETTDTVKASLHRNTITTKSGEEWYIPDIFHKTGIRTKNEPALYYRKTTSNSLHDVLKYGYCMGDVKEAVELGFEQRDPIQRQGSVALPKPVFVDVNAAATNICNQTQSTNNNFYDQNTNLLFKKPNLDALDLSFNRPNAIQKSM